MSYSLQFRDVFAASDLLLDGLALTLELSVVAMVSGLAIGTAGAAARVYGSNWLRRPVASERMKKVVGMPIAFGAPVSYLAAAPQGGGCTFTSGSARQGVISMAPNWAAADL